VYAAPPVVLGRQVIGVGFDEQLFEHRVHDVPPQAGEGAGGPAAAFAGTTRSSPWMSSRWPTFTGEANWNYLVAPFLFARLPGKIEAQGRTAGRGSVTAGSGDDASQLEAECPLIESATPSKVPWPVAPANRPVSACRDPVTSPMDGVWACRAGLVVIPCEHERVTIGCGQRLDVDIRKPSGQLAGPDTVM